MTRFHKKKRCCIYFHLSRHYYQPSCPYVDNIEFRHASVTIGPMSTIFGNDRQVIAEPKCYVLLWSLCECLMKVAVGKRFYFPAFNTWNPACIAFTRTSGICSFVLDVRESPGSLFFGPLCLCNRISRALVLLDGVEANNNGGHGFFYL